MSEKDDLPFLPTRHGTPMGERNEREQRAQVGPESIRRVQRDNLDGSTTVLHTRGGAFEYVTTKPEPEDPPPEGPLWSFDYFPIKYVDGNPAPDTYAFDGKDLWQADGVKGLKGRRTDFRLNTDGSKSFRTMKGVFDGEDEKDTLHGPGFWYGGKNGRDKVTWTRETTIRTGDLYGATVAIVSVVRHEDTVIKVANTQVVNEYTKPIVIIGACVVRDDAGTKYIRVAKAHLTYPAYTWMDQYNAKYGVHIEDYDLDGTLVSTVYSHTQNTPIEVDGVRMQFIMAGIRLSCFSPDGKRFITTAFSSTEGPVEPDRAHVCLIFDITRPLQPATPGVTGHLVPLPESTGYTETQVTEEIEPPTNDYTYEHVRHEELTSGFYCSAAPSDPSYFEYTRHHIWSSYHVKTTYFVDSSVVLVGFSKENVARVVSVVKTNTADVKEVYDYYDVDDSWLSDIQPNSSGSTMCAFSHLERTAKLIVTQHRDSILGHYNRVVLSEGADIILELADEKTISYREIQDAETFDDLYVADRRAGTGTWSNTETVVDTLGHDNNPPFAVASEFTCVGGDLQDGVLLIHTYGPYAYGELETRTREYVGSGPDYINGTSTLVSTVTTSDTRELPATFDHNLFVKSYPPTYDSPVRVEQRASSGGFTLELEGAWHPKKKHAVFINNQINNETWGSYYTHGTKKWASIVKGGKEPTATPLPAWYNEAPYGEYTITVKIAPCA